MTTISLPSPLYNAEYNEIKSKANREFERACERLDRRAISVADQDVYYATKSLHTLPSLLKKIAKALKSWDSAATAATYELEAARLGSIATREQAKAALLTLLTLCEEWAPTSAAIKAAKADVIKGRKPAAPKPARKNTKPRDWCGACLKDVAVDAGDYAHQHGYQRPGWGYNVGTCAGAVMRVITVSDEAILAEIAMLDTSEKHWGEQLQKRFTMTQDEFDVWIEARKAEGKKWYRLPQSLKSYRAEAAQAISDVVVALYATRARWSAWKPGVTGPEQFLTYEAAASSAKIAKREDSVL